MKKILCSKQGKVKKYTFVDDADYDWLSKFRWSSHKTRGGLWCAERALWKNHKYVGMQKMHRLIMKARKGQEVDHINRNGMDNRRKNLRICSRSENLINRGRFKNVKAKSVGVYNIHRKKNTWLAQVSRNNENYTVGVFKTLSEAVSAREEYLKNF